MLNNKESLIKIVENLSFMMEKYEEKALNNEELTSLTGKQINYIDIINEFNEPTFSQIAETLNVTKPTVTIAIDNLISRGYIKKIQSEKDRRVYHLRLTDKGKKVVKLHNKCHREFANKISNCLSPEETKNLVGILKKVVEI